MTRGSFLRAGGLPQRGGPCSVLTTRQIPGGIHCALATRSCLQVWPPQLLAGIRCALATPLLLAGIHCALATPQLPTGMAPAAACRYPLLTVASLRFAAACVNKDRSRQTRTSCSNKCLLLSLLVLANLRSATMIHSRMPAGSWRGRYCLRIHRKLSEQWRKPVAAWRYCLQMEVSTDRQ